MPPLPWRADLYSQLLTRILRRDTDPRERAKARQIMRDLVNGHDQPPVQHPNGRHGRAGMDYESCELFGDLIRQALKHRIEGPGR